MVCPRIHQPLYPPTFHSTQVVNWAMALALLSSSNEAALPCHGTEEGKGRQERRAGRRDARRAGVGARNHAATDNPLTAP